MRRILVTLIALAVPAVCADLNLVKTLADHWKTSKAYTLAIAEQMPEDGYASKPNPEQMTFAGQLEHIADSNAYFLSKITGGKSPIGKTEKHDKASVIKMLNASYDWVIGSIEKLSPDKLHNMVDTGEGKMSVLDALLLAADHTAHHRGQCVVYLRVKNIKPADYRF